MSKNTQINQDVLVDLEKELEVFSDQEFLSLIKSKTDSQNVIANWHNWRNTNESLRKSKEELQKLLQSDLEASDFKITDAEQSLRIAAFETSKNAVEAAGAAVQSVQVNSSINNKVIKISDFLVKSAKEQSSSEEQEKIKFIKEQVEETAQAIFDQQNKISKANDFIRKAVDKALSKNASSSEIVKCAEIIEFETLLITKTLEKMNEQISDVQQKFTKNVIDVMILAEQERRK